MLSSVPPFLQRSHSLWRERSSRERAWMLGAAVAIGGALWWNLGLDAALTTLRTADAQRELLQSQLLAMQAMASEAAALQKLPQPGADSRRQSLDLGLRQHLGSNAQLSVASERVTVSFRNMPGDALARWLIQSREDASAFPLSAQLTRSAARHAWDGSVVLTLQPP